MYACTVMHGGRLANISDVTEIEKAESSTKKCHGSNLATSQCDYSGVIESQQGVQGMAEDVAGHLPAA